MNYEDTVATAIIDVLADCCDADIKSGVGWMFQRPLTDEAKALRDKIGVAAIRAVAEWNLNYIKREQ